MLCISLRLVDLNNKKKKHSNKAVNFMSKKALLYCLRLGSEYTSVELRN